jgi:hypothetical protein
MIEVGAGGMSYKRGVMGVFVTVKQVVAVVSTDQLHRPEVFFVRASRKMKHSFR